MNVEDVLAIRRVAIIQMDAVPLFICDDPPEQLHLVEQTLHTALRTLEETRDLLGDRLLDAARLMMECLRHGGRIMVCGDSRSASYAQQFAAELAGDFILPGTAGLPVLSLTNEQVISTEVQAVGHPGDLLLGISAGGDSTNLADAFRLARDSNICCVSLAGTDSGDLSSLSDVALVIPSARPRRVQEVQMLILHLLCDLVGECMQGGAQNMTENFFDAARAFPRLKKLVG